MQKLIDKKIEITPRRGQNASRPLAPKKEMTFFGLFTSPRVESHGKATTTVFKEPALRSSPPSVPRANLIAVKSWVALEEKIVHDYKEQKTAQLKAALPLPKTSTKQFLSVPSNLNNPEKKISVPLAAKKGFTLFSFFNSSREEARLKNTAPVLRGSVLKSPPLNVPRANVAAVTKWVALEEKIIHDYREQKTAQFKNVIPVSKIPVKQSPRIPAKQPLPAFETFTTQTAVPLSPSIPKFKDPPRSSKKAFSGLAEFLLVCGWLVAGALILMYLQGALSNREALKRLTQLQSERDQLKQSYVELQNASVTQSAKIKGLNSQLRGLEGDLRTLQENKAEYGRSLEKKYRAELMRITAEYETQIDVLRGTIRTKDAIVNALKAQSHAFERIIEQAGKSALSGAAAGLSQEPFSSAETSTLQGKVASVNGALVVINMGATQGVSSGRLIKIFRAGVGIAEGSIDRIYPTMSVAVLRNASMLQMIRQGDSVSFS